MFMRTALSENRTVPAKPVVDFHTHILPGMDDGSSNVEESIAMLLEMFRQGTMLAAATPHYYACHEKPEEFLLRRERAALALTERIGGEKKVPGILLGAEVAYFAGMSLDARVLDLRIEGTDLLLLEMPFSEWTQRTIREVCSLNRILGIIPLIAHAERYLGLQTDEAGLWELIESGALIQANAGFFTGMRTGRKALRMLGDGEIHLLGSDCHNMKARKPNLGPATAKIGGRLGGQAVDRVRRLEQDLIKDPGKSLETAE